MEYEKIKQLMDDMGESKLTKIDIEFPDGTKISMEKNNKKELVTIENAPMIVPENSSKELVVSEPQEQALVKQEVKGNVMKSPMVGTFYAKPSPDSEPYVEVGSHVKKGDVLCIIEAMKLMNEIESEFDGVIKEVLIEDGKGVEYGKPLFIIE